MGYWNRPDLTRQSFVPNPFSAEPGARLYRTGDQARYLPDGTLEFAGRLDDQVKINGFRVHLSEVETGLLTIPGVRQAAVLARADQFGLKQLIAFVAPSNPGELAPAELRRAVREKLPSYMAPSRYVFLDSLPLTPNGKLDRNVLTTRVEAPIEVDATKEESGDPASPNTIPPPLDPVQRQIAAIWEEVFDRTEIGLDDSFFDLGGHSLIATRVISRVNQAFQASISLSALFEAPTVRTFADKVRTAAKDPSLGPIQRRARPATVPSCS